MFYSNHDTKFSKFPYSLFRRAGKSGNEWKESSNNNIFILVFGSLSRKEWKDHSTCVEFK